MIFMVNTYVSTNDPKFWVHYQRRQNFDVITFLGILTIKDPQGYAGHVNHDLTGSKFNFVKKKCQCSSDQNPCCIPSLGIQSPCQMMIRVYNHLLRKVFSFHYHSQKVIGSLGHYTGWLIGIQGSHSGYG